MWGIHYQTNIKLLTSDDPQAVSHKSYPTETSSVHAPKPVAGERQVEEREANCLRICCFSKEHINAAKQVATVDSYQQDAVNSPNSRALEPSASAR